MAQLDYSLKALLAISQLQIRQRNFHFLKETLNEYKLHEPIMRNPKIHVITMFNWGVCMVHKNNIYQSLFCQKLPNGCKFLPI